MIPPPVPDPPFDPNWLDLLVEGCSNLRGTHPRFEDLYLEHRLELRVTDESRFESCRTEGASARWRFPSRWAVHAATGVSAAAVTALVSRYADRLQFPPGRPPHGLVLDAPPGWSDWARGMTQRLADPNAAVRFITRRAIVVRRDGWRLVSCPPLIRLEGGSTRGTTMLAVWGQPKIKEWLREFLEPPPTRRWTPTPGSRTPVVFADGTAGALLHELVGHLVEGDLVATGRSPLAALAGANLTEAPLDLVDDPTRVDLPGAFSCDDEGVAAAPITLLRGGRLCGWLCDRETAAMIGGCSGRGRRADWRHAPVPRLSNLVVSAGSTPASAIEADLSLGLVVTRLAGATVDPVSGRTVLRVERGHEIRNGRRRRPAAPFELTGSVTEILAGIDPSVGDDPTPDWRLGWCVKDGLPMATGSEAPTLLVRRLEVL